MRGRTARLATAVAVLVALLFGVHTAARATPTHADLQAAKAKLRALIQQQGALIEAYDGAMVKLQQVEAQLAQAQAELQRERSIAAAANAQVRASAANAYENSGTEISMIFDSSSLSQLADRMQYLQAISQRNADAATRARVAQQLARVAAQRYATGLRQRVQLVSDLTAKKQQIEQSIGRQQSMVHKIERQIHRALVIIPPAPGTNGGGTMPGGLPPPPSPGAATAIAAAKSVLGVPYVWGGASPSGFDCSGLTMWAWAHAGVSLPHNAAMQYAALPHVSRSELAPGDLVFFFSPIEHVGLYIGNGLMIDAPYTGTVVRIDPVFWSAFVGAARP